MNVEKLLMNKEFVTDREVTTAKLVTYRLADIFYLPREIAQYILRILLNSRSGRYLRDIPRPPPLRQVLPLYHLRKGYDAYRSNVAMMAYNSMLVDLSSDSSSLSD